jgi:hypothetical protein
MKRANPQQVPNAGHAKAKLGKPTVFAANAE